MIHRYFFFVIFTLLLSVMGWWSNSLQSRELGRAPAQAQLGQNGPQSQGLADSGSWLKENRPEQLQERRELLEVLDRVVAYQHYYHSVYGHFTKLLNRIGFQIPGGVASTYEIRVAEASSDRLLVTALSEVDGKTMDLVSIDQNYRIHANFPLPAPRPEYLKANAMKHLRQLKEAPAGQVIEEQGVFSGYFKYELRRDSEDRRVAFAVGMRPPVQGVQLEAGAGLSIASDESYAMEEIAGLSSVSGTGQRPVGEMMAGTEQAYLAQRIFLGEVGRYARSWSELSRIAHFQFPERMVAQDSQFAVPVPSAAVPGTENDLEQYLQDSKGLESSGRGKFGALEIEPLPAEEN